VVEVVRAPQDHSGDEGGCDDGEQAEENMGVVGQQGTAPIGEGSSGRSWRPNGLRLGYRDMLTLREPGRSLR